MKLKIALLMVLITITISVTSCQKIKDMFGSKDSKTASSTQSEIGDSSNPSSNTSSSIPIEESSQVSNVGDFTSQSSGVTESTDGTSESIPSDEQAPHENLKSVIDIFIDGTVMYNIYELIDKNIDQSIIDKSGMTRAGVLAADGVTLEEEYKPTKTEEVIFRVFKVDGSYKDYKVTFKLDLSKEPARSFKERNPQLFKWAKGKHIWRRFVNSIIGDADYDGSWDGEPFVSGDSRDKVKDIADNAKFKKDDASSENPLGEIAKPVKDGTELTIGNKNGKLLLKNDESITVKDDGKDRAIITVPTQNTYEISMKTSDEIKKLQKESMYDTNDFDFRRFTITKSNPEKKDYGSLTRYKIKYKANGTDKEYPYMWVIKTDKNYFMIRNISMYEGRVKELDSITNWIRKGK
jgi:lipoprotein